MEEIKESEILVSDEFVEIFENLNVFDQYDNMMKLNKRDLYLLLTLSLDKYPFDDTISVYNFKKFEKEVMEIFDIFDDKETTNIDLIKLIEETGDKYIETDNIVDKNGNKLRDPLDKIEVRNKRIGKILD